MNDWIHENTQWKTFKHSYGTTEGFPEQFIKAGFDIINPVQGEESGLNPKDLKKKYGRSVVFWGGGVDTRKTLQFGTPEQVREEVLRNSEVYIKNGGFVFSASHNISATTPVENIVAMLKAVREFNGN
jgi:uroporphyrinogen-III decarboxylase